MVDKQRGEPDFSGKHVVIAGGASGFGRGCVERFVRQGARVTIADIDRAGGQAAAEHLSAVAGRAEACRFEPLDLNDAESIERLAGRFGGERVDVLLNNAGIYPPAQRTLDPAGRELTFAIAYLGHFCLTAALWPALLASPQPRVIGVTSMVQRRARLNLDDLTLAGGYKPIRAYQQAKLACLMFALELDRRCREAGSPMRSLAVHPGICRSNLGDNRQAGAADNPWQRLMRHLQAHGLHHFGQSPLSAARVATAAAGTGPEGPAFLGPKGPFQAFGPIGAVAPGAAARDPAARASLWRRTEALTGVGFPGPSG